MLTVIVHEWVVDLKKKILFYNFPFLWECTIFIILSLGAWKRMQIAHTNAFPGKRSPANLSWWAICSVLPIVFTYSCFSYYRRTLQKCFLTLPSNADLQIAHLPQNASHWSKTTMARNSTWAGNSQRSIGLRNGTSLITTGFFKCYIQSDTKIVSYDNKLISVFLMWVKGTKP